MFTLVKEKALKFKLHNEVVDPKTDKDARIARIKKDSKPAPGTYKAATQMDKNVLRQSIKNKFKQAFHDSFVVSYSKSKKSVPGVGHYKKAANVDVLSKNVTSMRTGRQ